VKVTIQLASLILAVRHNLCYSMSNKPRTASDFFPNYNRRPNLPILKESQIQIYVYLYAYSFIYAFIPSADVKSVTSPIYIIYRNRYRRLFTVL
jgi:hypothetical protein